MKLISVTLTPPPGRRETTTAGHKKRFSFAAGRNIFRIDCKLSLTPPPRHISSSYLASRNLSTSHRQQHLPLQLKIAICCDGGNSNLRKECLLNMLRHAKNMV